ncbi:MAG TPA: tripartite tricarboxylate transporter substrate binding protein [Ramlibacter sp.]|nr:tripartite tricarboxylate transporter substrate binding protein [Ramlibacter sp.]
MKRRHLVISAAAAASLHVPAWAAYPERPITFVVPFPPGGPADGYGRALAQALSEQVRQPVVVDNRSGAGGALGVQTVARAAADGYTIGMAGTGATVFQPLLSEKALIDVFKETTMLSKMVRTPNFLVIGAGVKANSAAELVALARARPGQLTFASAGAGSGPHILGELFKQHANVDILHIPYKGAAPALQDLMAGQVDMFFGEAPGVLSLIRGGKLRALFTTDTRRAKWLPDVPHAGEVGLAGVVAEGSYGVVAPPGLPAETAATLRRALNEALRSPKLAEAFDQRAGIPEPSTSEEYAAYLRSEQSRWLPVVRKANIRLE